MWNPNAAANWSLLFTPAFGAYLHAVNWRTLGEPKRAAANVTWICVTIAYLVIVIATVLLPDQMAVEVVLRLAGLGLLIGWYFSQGRAQVKYIKETLGDEYERRGWARPLLAGVALIGVFLTTSIILALATHKPDPDVLAAEIKPLILQEWQKQPVLRGASIQSLTLDHKGGNSYRGVINATLDGRPERLLLEVEYDGQTIEWQTKAPGD